MPIVNSRPAPSPTASDIPICVDTLSRAQSNSVQAPEQALLFDLEPPRAIKNATAVINYQSRWEREKAKARAEGHNLETEDPKVVGPWVLGEMLGRGASGRVRLARHYTTGKMAAIKILNFHPHLSSPSSTLANARDKTEKALLTAEREIAVMKLLDHPNIMKMYDVWSSPKELYLVLEYIQGGELFDYLCSRKERLPLLEAVSIIKQVLAGVNYCHHLNICHRDLKPENILLVDASGSTTSGQVKHVKIADFGMSTLDSLNGLLRTSCGSPHYASPEIVRGQTYSGSASDIWSCGVILYALLTSRLPFDDPNVNNVLKKVRDGNFIIPDWVVPPAKDLVTKMLEVDINQRITMPDIFAHPLLQMDTPGIVLEPIPNLEEIALPVIEEEVDPDLLRNLCTIWREKNKASMIARLCSTEKNYEKAFYFLLCLYRDRSFEDRNMDVSPFLSVGPSDYPSPFFPSQCVDTKLDRVEGSIKRHYPGRISSAHLTKKRPTPPRLIGNLCSSKIRCNGVLESGVGSEGSSPRRSQDISKASRSNNSPEKRTARRSRVDSVEESLFTHTSLKHEATTPAHPTLTKPEFWNVSTAPRKVSNLSPSKRAIAAKAHSISSSASRGITSPRGIIRNPEMLPNSSVKHANARMTTRLPLDTAIDIPVFYSGLHPLSDDSMSSVSAGIAERRTPFTSKMTCMNDRHGAVSTIPATSIAPLSHLAAPIKLTQPLNIHHCNRLADSNNLTSTRSFSKMDMYPTIFYPVSQIRATSALLHTQSGKANRLPLQQVESNVPSKSSHHRTRFEAPPKATILEKTTPVFSGSPIIVRGVKTFVSPSEASFPSTSKAHTPPSILNWGNDSTCNILSIPGMQADAKWRIGELDLGKNLSDTIGRCGDDTINDPIGRRNGSREHIRISGNTSLSFSRSNVCVSNSANVSTSGKISTNAANIGGEAWEKLDWSCGSLNSHTNRLNVDIEGNHLKSKSPLDPIISYHRDHHSHITVPTSSLSDAPKKSQSPLLSSLTGFSGISWADVAATPSIPPFIAYPMGASGSASNKIGGGRSLFAKLFYWKSPNLRLISMESIVATKEECARCLKALRIKYVPSESGGFKCRTDEIVDLSGNRITKTARFYVFIEALNAPLLPTSQLVSSKVSSTSDKTPSSLELELQWNSHLDIPSFLRTHHDVNFNRTPKGTRATSCQNIDAGRLMGLCTVTLVHGKGAYSVLTIVYQRMQQLWRAEKPEWGPIPVSYPLTPVSAKPFTPVSGA